MAKKKTGQINFFRFMALIGLVVIGGLGYGFYGAAPNLTDTEYHTQSTPQEACLQCHVIKPQQSPIMPHRPMGSCTFCHRPPNHDKP